MWFVLRSVFGEYGFLQIGPSLKRSEVALPNLLPFPKTTGFSDRLYYMVLAWPSSWQVYKVFLRVECVTNIPYLLQIHVLSKYKVARGTELGGTGDKLGGTGKRMRADKQHTPGEALFLLSCPPQWVHLMCDSTAPKGTDGHGKILLSWI